MRSFTIRPPTNEPLRKTLRTFATILTTFALLLFLCSCGGPRIKSVASQTVSDFEQSNQQLHLVSSKIKDTTDIRTYRNWSWSSVGSYFKPNRTYRITFVGGLLSTCVEE